MPKMQDKANGMCYNAAVEEVAESENFPHRQSGLVAALMKGKCDMVKQIKISSFNEVKTIVAAATSCLDQIGVHDQQGSIADAKSILGMMSLDYTQPVLLVSENPCELERVYKALAN